MAEIYRLYLDQMFHLDVALALLHEGYDVLRAAETGHARADTSRYWTKRLQKIVYL